MTESLHSTTTPDTPASRMKAFLDREEATIKAERIDGEAIVTAIEAMRTASFDSDRSLLSIIAILTGHQKP